MADAIQPSSGQIREEVFRQYECERPRVGPELDAFVAKQCDYFKLTEKEVRVIVGHAQKGIEAMFRGGMQTGTQRICEAMDLSDVDLVAVLKESLYATKKRVVIDKSGRAVPDKDGNPIFIETPDHANRLKAVDLAAKLKGSYAPRQLQIEARHEHHHSNITDDELRNQIRELAAGFGLNIVDAEYAVVDGEPGATPPAAKNPAIGPGGA